VTYPEGLAYSIDIPLILLWIIKTLSIFPLPRCWPRDKCGGLNIFLSSTLSSDSVLVILVPNQILSLNGRMFILKGEILAICYIQVHSSRKLHPRGNVTSKTYKPVFHSSHLSCNMSYGSAAILWVFHLPWQRYSYSTWSSMMELLLLVSQHWNFCSE